MFLFAQIEQHCNHGFVFDYENTAVTQDFVCWFIFHPMFSNASPVRSVRWLRGSKLWLRLSYWTSLKTASVGGFTDCAYRVSVNGGTGIFHRMAKRPDRLLPPRSASPVPQGTLASHRALMPR
jgi:hypothetical protein